MLCSSAYRCLLLTGGYLHWAEQPPFGLYGGFVFYRRVPLNR